jgi:hypothetical protein
MSLVNVYDIYPRVDGIELKDLYTHPRGTGGIVFNRGYTDLPILNMGIDTLVYEIQIVNPESVLLKRRDDHWSDGVGSHEVATNDVWKMATAGVDGGRMVAIDAVDQMIVYNNREKWLRSGFVMEGSMGSWLLHAENRFRANGYVMVEATWKGASPPSPDSVADLEMHMRGRVSMLPHKRAREYVPIAGKSLLRAMKVLVSPALPADAGKLTDHTLAWWGTPVSTPESAHMPAKSEDLRVGMSASGMLLGKTRRGMSSERGGRDEPETCKVCGARRANADGGYDDPHLGRQYCAHCMATWLEQQAKNGVPPKSWTSPHRSRMGLTNAVRALARSGAPWPVSMRAVMPAGKAYTQ